MAVFIYLFDPFASSFLSKREKNALIPSHIFLLSGTEIKAFVPSQIPSDQSDIAEDFPWYNAFSSYLTIVPFVPSKQ